MWPFSRKVDMNAVFDNLVRQWRNDDERLRSLELFMKDPRHSVPVLVGKLKSFLFECTAWIGDADAASEVLLAMAYDPATRQIVIRELTVAARRGDGGTYKVPPGSLLSEVRRLE